MLVELSNTPRPYQWGDSHSLATWQGRRRGPGPEAELWLGTHPGSEAHVIPRRPGSAPEPLAKWLTRQGLAPELEFLTKLLAAGKPLSIQVHPTRAQAEAGFAREEFAGVAKDASDRNYRDQSDKPEVLIAWSEHFDALVGFQNLADASSTVEAIATLLGDTERVAHARQALSEGIKGLVGWLFSGDTNVKALASAITEAFQEKAGDKTSSDRERIWRAVIPEFPGDPGIVTASFMNLVELHKGEALFVPPGIVHAYLAGFGLEVMAPSDNVLRGGLTPKHIDLDELGSVVQPVSFTDARLEPKPRGAGQVFAPDGAAFSILHVAGQSGEPVNPNVRVGEPSIVVGHAGNSVLSDGFEDFDIVQGHAYLWLPESSHQTLSGSGSVYVVSGVTG